MSKLGLAAGRPTATKKKPDMSDTASPLVRINAQITEAERDKLKIYCVKNKTSITDLLREFIAKLPD